MKKMTWRPVARAALAVTHWVSWPVAGLAMGLLLLAGCNSVNPFLLAFLTEFEIRNETGEDLFVTPLGASRPCGMCQIS